MREPHVHGFPPPRDWGEAFAALPPETPPTDSLSPVFARIPASTPTRPSRQWWIAAAAVLALAAIVPMTVNFVRHPGASQGPAVAIQKPELDTRPQGPREAAGFRRDDGAGNATVSSQNRSRVAASVMPTADAVDRKTLDARLRGHDEQKQIAKADTPHRKPHRMRKSSLASEPADKLMEPLYAESARLEALLALARDDRVGSATAVALGDDFQAQVAGIDVALAQPSLDAKQRLALWRQRVDALRAYASFESTQRALAASGERYDAMLVSID
jgi:hypothetical protein